MAVHTISRTGALVALFVQANKILASLLHSEVLDLLSPSEIPDQDLSPAETSTMALAIATPVATSTTVTSVVPHLILPVGATGSHLPHPTEPSGPGSRTPLRPLIIERELADHPDKAFVKQLISNLIHGCSNGYHGPHDQFAANAKHLSSALQHTNIIDESLRKETEAGRILGPFHTPSLPNLQCSGLGAIPKHYGGWRIIYHLSAPAGSSINDFIDSNTYTLSYCTVDDAYAIINKLGLSRKKLSPRKFLS